MYPNVLRAFDTVDHVSLFYVLDKLGVGEPLFFSFLSYLDYRTQYIDLFGMRFKKCIAISSVS